MQSCPQNVPWLLHNFSDAHILSIVPKLSGIPAGHILLSLSEGCILFSDRLRELKAVAHANTSLKQFVIFSQQFGLVGERDMQPLQRIIRDLLGHSNSTV